MLNFLVVDDHRSVRMGLKVMLYEIFSENIVEEAASFTQAVDLLGQKKYNLVILDIGIPGGLNIEMIDYIRKRQGQVPILMYTGAEESKFALRYLKQEQPDFYQKMHRQRNTKLL